MTFEAEYLELVEDVLAYGQDRKCRNGMTKALFGETLIIRDLQHGRFPLLTQRRIAYKGVFGELAAFVRGATTVGEFKKWGCNYWDDNARAWKMNEGIGQLEDMTLGQIYGAQWVNWEQTGYNQLRALVSGLKLDPHGRRHILQSYSPTAVACLPACHLMAQFFVNDNTEALDCQVYMRSVDLLIGLPSDIVLYAALLIQVAGSIARPPGELIFVFGDTHVYENHIETFIGQHQFAPMYELPTYTSVGMSVEDFDPRMIQINDYNYHQTVRYEFNV
jgi:thymidylate synthase